VFGLLTLAQLAAGAGAAERDSGWIEQERLDAGEILVSFGDNARFRGLIRAAVFIHADPRAIWSVLGDCETAPEYVPHILSCRLIETLEEGRAQIFLQVVKFAWFLPRQEHVFRLDYQPYSRMDVNRVSGPMEHMEGTWWLVPDEDRGTRVIYELVLKPGPLVPMFVVGAILKRDIPLILEAVRERAEALD